MMSAIYMQFHHERYGTDGDNNHESLRLLNLFYAM